MIPKLDILLFVLKLNTYMGYGITYMLHILMQSYLNAMALQTVNRSLRPWLELFEIMPFSPNAIIVTSALLFTAAAASTSDTRKNVLFIIADYLRNDLGIYDGATSVHPHIHTPNLDALAAKSPFLRRAYVQYPLCTLVDRPCWRDAGRRR